MSKGFVVWGNIRGILLETVTPSPVRLTSIKSFAVKVVEAKNSSSLSVQLVNTNTGIINVRINMV